MELHQVLRALASSTTPPCAYGVVFVVVASMSQEAVVATDVFGIFGWLDASSWERPTGISGGSTANAVHFSSQENPSMDRYFK